MNNNEYGMDNPIPIPIPIHKKPHRKVLTGLKLLTESYKFIHSTHKQQDHVSTHQTQLPHDLILHHILAKMPIKSLLQSKLVSKQWYYTLSSNEFANLHLKTCFSSYHPMNSHVECLFIQVEKRFYLFHIQEEDVKIHYSLVKLEPNFGYTPQNELYLVGSCNGLVCLSDSVNGCFYLWNPVIYHWMRFSDLFLGSGYKCRSSWGFGYVLSVNDYKVVKIEQKYDTNEVIVLLFSLQTKEWRRIFDHGLEDGVSLTKTSPGVLVNDTLFWIVDHPIKRHIVVGFDLVFEKFEEISGLTPRSREGYRDRFLCVMGGCLALYSSNLYKKGCVSILKKPGYVESVSVCSNSDSWSCTSLVGFTRTGKSLVVSKNWELGVVDLDSSPREYLTLLTFDKTRNSPCILSYCPSLISLM